MRQFMGTFVVAALIVSPLLAAPAGKPKDLIVGKWQAGDMAAVLEFHKDGKLTVTAGGKKIEGTYKFTADDAMEVVLDFGKGDKKTQKLSKVKIENDELSTTDEMGKTEKFKKAK